MQYLYCALVAAVIATGVANPTADKASMSSIEDRTRAADKACMHMRNTDSNRCFADCTYRHLGILDSEGRYVQSVIAEVLSSQFPALTQQQVTEATTTCSSALDKWVDGCGRADIVYECIHAALEKMARSFNKRGDQ